MPVDIESVVLGKMAKRPAASGNVDIEAVVSRRLAPKVNTEQLGAIYGDPALADPVGYETGISQSPDTSTMDALKGANAGIVRAFPGPAPRIAQRYIGAAPVDTALAPDDPLYSTTAGRVIGGITRTLPEAIVGGVAGAAVGMPSVGVGGALAAGQADELAYQEMVRREQSGAEGGYMGDLAIGSGFEARDEADTLPMRIARGASVPAAGLLGAGGAALGRSAGAAANIGYNLIANPLETGLQAYGQGADPLDPAMLGTSALIGGLAEGAGRIRPKAKPVTDLAPLPRPQQMGPLEVIAEPLPLPPGNVPRALPDLNVDRPGLSGMPDGMVTLEVGPDGSTYVRDTPPSILPGGNFTEADVARAQQMQELALIKERSARGLPPPFLEQRGLPPSDAGLGVRYADDETLNTVQMAREAGLPPVQRYTSGGRPLDGGQAPPDYPDIGVGAENPLPPLSRPGVIPRKAMRGEPIPAPRELPPPVERVPEAMPEPIRNKPQPIAEESATPPPMAGAEPAPLPDVPVRGKKAAPVAEAPKAKEPWEMTRDEVVSQAVRDADKKPPSSWIVIDQSGKPVLELFDQKKVNALKPQFTAVPKNEWDFQNQRPLAPNPSASADRRAAQIEELQLRHKKIVSDAHASGKPVPHEVLADYPDLVKKGGDPPAQQMQEGQEEGLLTPAQVEPTQQAEAPTFTARNLAKGRATEIARESRGSVVPDPDNPKKWAVVSGKQKPQPPKPTGGEPSPLPKPDDPKVYGGPAAILEPITSKVTPEAVAKVAAPESFRRPVRVLAESKPGREAIDLIVKAKTRERMIAGDAAVSLGDVQKNLRGPVKDAADRVIKFFKSDHQLEGNDVAWIRDNMRGYIEAGRKMPNPRIQAYADAWKRVSDGFAAKARKLGVTVRENGVERPFAALKNYFPHMLTDDAMEALQTKRGPLYDAIARDIKTKGIPIEKLDDFISADTIRRSGHLEETRFLPDFVMVNGKKVMLHETDPFKVLPKAVDSQARRLAFIETFGQKDASKKITALREAIFKEQGSFAQSRFDDAILDLQQMPNGRPLPKAVQAADTIATTHMLSMSPLGNVLGPVGTATRFGFGKTVKAHAKSLDERIRRNLNAYGVKVNESKYKAEIDNLERLGAWGRDSMAKHIVADDMAGKIGKVSRLALRGFGLNMINVEIDRGASLAASAALQDAVQFLRKPTNSGTFKKVWGGMSEPQIKDMLYREFELSESDVNRMVKDGIQTEDFARASQRATSKINLRDESPLEKPRWMNHSYVRPFLRLSSYVRSASGQISDALHYAKQGNVAPLARLMFASAIGGTAMAEFRDFLNKKEREDKTFYGMLWRGMMQTATFGLWGDLATTMYWGSMTGRNAGGGVVESSAMSWYGKILGEATAEFMSDAKSKKDRSLGEKTKAAIEKGGKAYIKNTPLFRTANGQAGDPIGLQKKPRELPPPWEDRPRRPRRKREEF